MPRNNQRRSNNNNPEGHNQFDSGWMGSARERPFAAATVAAATVGAGVFLWSRRNQISEQLSSLSDQIGEWSQTMNSGRESGEFEMAGGSESFEASGGSGSTSGISTGSTGRRGGSKSSGSAGMSETGSGNSSLGAHSGGGGMSAGNSGRSRA